MKRLLTILLLIVGCEENSIAVLSSGYNYSSMQGYFLETKDGIDVYKKIQSEEYCLNSTMCTVNECDSTLYAYFSYGLWSPESEYIDCNNLDSSYYSLI